MEAQAELPDFRQCRSTLHSSDNRASGCDIVLTNAAAILHVPTGPVHGLYSDDFNHDRSNTHDRQEATNP
ncbi:hypothetical protein HNQ77_004832 [Silvibacterium bohemicum]|uniref:Uncharacterized protein n=1 Tax=Silvibacterium bohemicum TaxID=1577686 RepID=A0A841K6T9_9BACT|nr:hypothetical protein [Silvibacterium bohemicum]